MQIAALVGAFRRAAELCGRNDPVWEFHNESESVGRAVIQVPVDVAFFAVFFNSPDGYRAMFRRGRRVGSATNAALVDSVSSILAGALADSVEVATIRNSSDGPTLMGRITLPRSTFLRSLDPSLAKVWYATSDVRPGGIGRLSPGVSSEKIDVGLTYPWAKTVQDPGNCSIEVKGAFVASCVSTPDVKFTVSGG